MFLLAPAAIGCAVDTDGAASDPEDVGTDSEELTAVGRQLVGNYYGKPEISGFARLNLSNNGKYTAKLDATGVAVCVTSPCLIPESGTWSAYKQGSALKLRVKPQGAPARIYDATKYDASIDFTSGIVLKRLGKTQDLRKLAASACLDNSDCKATEECGPKVCLMYCLVDDPFCCGPSTCEPKAPPPPPPGGSCCDPSKKPPPGIEGVWCCADGSWQYDIGSGNEAMSCGSHGAGGNVCAGEKCGTSTCGAGTTCCNPLMGICVPPGGVCAF